MKWILKTLPLAFLVVLSLPASAQTTTKLCVQGTNSANPGNSCPLVDATNPLPVTASVTVGGFAPNGNAITQQSVTSSSASTALPAGTTVLVQNTGTTNGLTFKLGIGSSTATANDIYVGPGAGCAVVVGTNTFIGFKTASSTTTLNVTGGTGLGSCPTGGGGGSGGGGAITAASGSYSSGALSSGSIASGAVASGAVASGAFASGSIGSGAIASGAVASGAYASGSIASGAIVDGADVTQGAKTDSVCGTATGTCTITALIKYLNSQVAAMPNTGGCGSIIPISQTTSTDLHTSSGKSYICSIVLVVPDAEVVSLVEGTGSVCATGVAAVIGATTAANGMSFAANGGFSAVSSAPMFNTQTTNDHWCLLQSGSGRIAGFISYNDH